MPYLRANAVKATNFVPLDQPAPTPGPAPDQPIVDLGGSYSNVTATSFTVTVETNQVCGVLQLGVFMDTDPFEPVYMEVDDADQSCNSTPYVRQITGLRPGTRYSVQYTVRATPSNGEVPGGVGTTGLQGFVVTTSNQ